MEHVVFFTGPDGGSHFRRTGELDEAVRFVEHLRNVEGVDDATVYALTEVPLNFRAYYRVEIGADGVAGSPPPPAAGGEPPPPPLTEGVPPLTDAAAAAFADAMPPAAPPAEGEGGDGPRSLSFFGSS